MLLSRLQVFLKWFLIYLTVGVILFTSGAVINLMQCILYFCLRPINKRMFRKVNWYLCAAVHSQLAFLGDWWANTKIILYIDKTDFDKYLGHEHAFGIMNHSYFIDWLLIAMLCDKVRLIGNIRVFVKKALQHLPIVGWTWKLSEFVMLERSFVKDKDIINRQIKELTDYPDPMWLVICPEGARFTDTKHKVSKEFAQERNLPQLKYHLQPRTRGFSATLPAIKDKFPAIYDILLVFDEVNGVPVTLKSIFLRKKLIVHIYLQRIPMQDVPNTQAEQEEFLRQLFVKKDKMRDSFVKTGDLFTMSGVERVVGFQMQPRIHILINQLVISLVTLSSIIYVLVQLLCSGSTLYVSVGLSLVLFFLGILCLLIATADGRISSYGSTAVPGNTR